ncbi:hypothetical protein HPP92_023003 [Vanilla planifolia]|uniref:Uncharacterized protein n=1 Tax=Vanilla planifolia TaxID=51239 RepID=A0A835PTB4_VANPL|nr:hypothetical protein HPP92_023269 [Vanilla planifolia]KAG0459875.1 hypothetical protein HPP92_023003 [Vanilla planifolia]
MPPPPPDPTDERTSREEDAREEEDKEDQRKPYPVDKLTINPVGSYLLGRWGCEGSGEEGDTKM